MGVRDFDEEIWARAGAELGLSARVAPSERADDEEESANHNPLSNGVFARVPRDFAALRSRIGPRMPLEQATVHEWLAGRYRGREVVVRRSGAGWATHFAVGIDPPLRFGLRLRPGVALPGGRFHGLFSVNGLEPERLDALFATPAGAALAERLVEQCERSMVAKQRMHFASLRDTVSASTVVEQPTGASFFVSWLEAAIDAADALEQASRELGPSAWEETAAANLTTVAASHGLTFDPARLALDGVFSEVPVRLETRVTPRTIRTVARARIDPPLGISLHLAKERPLASLRALVGLGDIATGDHAFDAAFFVGGSSKERVRAALSAEVRGLLLAAWAGGAGGAEVEARDDEVSIGVTGSPGDRGVERLVELAAGIARGLTGRKATGSPYR